MTRRSLALSLLVTLIVVVAVAEPRATHPETSEDSVSPVYPGADYSAASLVPGAPLDPALVPAAAIGDVRAVGAPPSPAPTQEVGSEFYSGLASWFETKGDQAAVPWWTPGQDPVWMSICRFADGRSRCVSALVTGFCQCFVGTAQERAVDLSRGAFEQLADLSMGVIAVTIEIPTQGPLPQTDGSEP